jgi:signal transduction histidine kinase
MKSNQMTVEGKFNSARKQIFSSTAVALQTNSWHNNTSPLHVAVSPGVKPALTIVKSDNNDAIIADMQQAVRQMIGRELHDNVNQILSTVKLLMMMMRPAAEKDNELRSKCIEYIRLAIQEIRKLSGEFVTPVQKESSLVEKIQGIIDDITLTTPLKIQFNYSGDIDSIDRDKKITLLRIVQEQTNNIIKHSRAGKVTVNIDEIKGESFLSIKDDGVGFNINTKKYGIGLLNIQERIHSHEGTLEIITKPGKGCALSVTIPV